MFRCDSRGSPGSVSNSESKGQMELRPGNLPGGSGANPHLSDSGYEELGFLLSERK
jgi:hypothetical protein